MTEKFVFDEELSELLRKIKDTPAHHRPKLVRAAIVRLRELERKRTNPSTT